MLTNSGRLDVDLLNDVLVSGTELLRYLLFDPLPVEESEWNPEMACKLDKIR